MRAPAQTWWERSVTVAEKLGARYELGVTYLEMGRRMRDRACLERAEATFIGVGAALELAQARELLRRGSLA